MRNTIHIIARLFAILTAIVLLPSCMERLDVELASGEYLTFRASLGEKDSLKTRSFAPHFSIVEEVWPLELDRKCADTKATLIYSLNDYNTLNDNSAGAGVFGYYYSSSDEAPKYTVWSQLENLNFKFDGDEMTSENPPRWSTLTTGQGDMLRIFSYAPYDSEETDNIISITDIAESQTDIIAAVSEPIDVSTSSPRESIKLDFEHIFTAIKINPGDFAGKISRISISGIHTGGTFTIGSGWTSNQNTNEYKIENISDALASPILMIPQKLGADSKLSVVTDDGTYSVSLAGKEWKQGKLITYTLNKEADVSDYIYFDLAAGDVVITDDSYSGKIFSTTTTTNDAGESVTTTDKEEVTGENTDGKKYYVYQSTEANKSTTGMVEGDLILPVYPPVTYKGELWTDFIEGQTGEDGVTTVIEAWDRLSETEDGPAKSTIDDYLGLSAEKLNETKYNDGVRGAGRTATDYRIDIEGDVGNTTLVIDNIYSAYQEVGESGERFDRYRTEGGISFRPSASGSKLTVNIVGDNRLGCVHYSNNKKDNGNELIFKGAGSLTVANTDFWKKTENGITGYYRNRSCSVIGSADYLPNSSKDDHAYNITIESGIIYAGATKAEFCTAIGGGGNGNSTITIKGGTVIAVASGTGTAIGGGSGMSQAGGEGTVTIEGGNVYAYNHANVINIPSSAIGGAGSKNDIGSLGTVTIAGGNVYAYSGLGTAIGGGSSFSQSGGNAEVTITGGNVIARSGSDVSAGIGGGTTRAGGENCGVSWNSNKSKNKNGGNATINIGIEGDRSANPILRTGSIGGGGSKKSDGNIGNATINIYGGDIQAQFVMADSPDNSFNMSGGLIRNSDTSDDEYTCIQKNGGAVYMEKGECNISGDAIIKKCSASSKTSDAKGGAIYIKGGTFDMSGGVIEQCSSNSDGGAIYLEGGDVILTGGTISNNVALNGNGGAVCIQGGNFLMKDAEISNNAAFDKNHSGTGNGGGIYVTSSEELTVKLISGTISGNSSGRYGGGVCVDMRGKDDITTTVNVGTKDSIPAIDNNAATHKGGGIYVDGTKASVNLNNGTVRQNQTTAYQINPDVAVENGLVTLAKDGITTQVTITFKNNNLYYNSEEDQTETQFVVSYTNNTLRSDVFDKLDSYYNTFVEWNTRRDGKGESYSNGQVVKLKENITLYARWKNQ